MIFHMGGKVKIKSRLRKGLPGIQWTAVERAAHEADCIELLSRRQAVGEETGQVAKKAKTPMQTEGLASLDFATCIDDTVHMLTSKSLDQYQHDGPLPLERVPRALTIAMDFLQYQWRVGWFMRQSSIEVKAHSRDHPQAHERSQQCCSGSGKD